MRNLNKPPRYNVASVQAQQMLGGDVMESAEYGQYVEWRDYAWLIKEVERLKADLADEKSANASVEGRQNSANRGLSMRNHLLKAEVERLIKAGDAMSNILIGRITSYEIGQAIDQWDAAKKNSQ
jgi:hypothetical protein